MVTRYGCLYVATNIANSSHDSHAVIFFFFFFFFTLEVLEP